MTRLLLAALALVLLLAAPALAGPPTTGFEQRNGASFTTHEEELAFLAAVDAQSARMTSTIVGTTAHGRPLHLVEVSAPGPVAPANRPTAMLVCSQHGNEPAGREACLKLLRDLAFTTDAGLADLLSRTTWLFVPSANPDGRARNSRGNSGGTDINRDHLGLGSPEAQAMAAVVRDRAPDVLIDLHEYGPSMPVIYDDSVLWLWPRNLNADAQVHDIAIELGRDYLVPAAQAKGFTTDEYGQYEVADNDIHQVAGDEDEGIMRNAMGLRHVIGLLVETRVDADVRTGPTEPLFANEVALRRVRSHLAVLDGLLEFMGERGVEAAALTAAARDRKTAEGAARSAPVYFGGADNRAPTAAQTVDPPPCGYGLTDEQALEVAPQLALHGIRLDRIDGSPFVSSAQPAEPVIPLLLDARGRRHIAEATPLDDCPAPPAGGGAERGAPRSGAMTAGSAPPRAPAAPRCASTRRAVVLPKPRTSRDRRLRTTVRVDGRRAELRRGVLVVRPRSGRTTSVVFTQRVRRDGDLRTVRTVRRVRGC